MCQNCHAHTAGLGCRQLQGCTSCAGDSSVNVSAGTQYATLRLAERQQLTNGSVTRFDFCTHCPARATAHQGLQPYYCTCQACIEVFLVRRYDVPLFWVSGTLAVLWLRVDVADAYRTTGVAHIPQECIQPTSGHLFCPSRRGGLVWCLVPFARPPLSRRSLCLICHIHKCLARSIPIICILERAGACFKCDIA